MTKTCWKCKGPVLRGQKSGKSVKKNGEVKWYFICTDCNTKWHREYKRKRGTEYTRETYRKNYEKHKHKWIARAKVYYALKKGTLKRPERCEVCERKKPLQGHHPDYSKPLEVIWLCSGCHTDEHNRLDTN